MARNIVSGFLSIFSSRIAVLFITFVSTPIIARLLDTGGYGDFRTITAIFSMLMIFVSSGISEGVQKFTGQRETIDWRSNVIGFYFRAGVAVAVLVGLGLFVFTSLGFADLAGQGFEIYFYLLAVLVLAAQLREYTRRTLMGLDLERYSEPLVVANTLIWVVVGIALAKYWASSPTEQVMSLLIGQIVAGFAVAAVGFPIIFRRVEIGRLFDRTPSNYPVREFLSFNGMTIVLLFLVTSLYKVDIVLIRAWVGPSRAGIYSAALALAEYLWFIPTTLQILFIHSTSDLWEQRRISIINDMASRATRYTALVVALMALGIAALAPLFVPWYYSASYSEAVTPLYVLLPGAVAFAIARPMFSIGQGNGNLRPLIMATGVAAGVNLVLNVLLIPRFGILGAAFATSLGYASMLAMHTWSARRIGFNPVDDLRAGRIAATAALSAIPIFWLPGFIANLGLKTIVVPVVGYGVPTALFVLPVVGVVVYTLIAVGTGALDVDEVLEILASFPEPIGPRATAFRREVSGWNAFNTNMLSKLLTGAGFLLLVLGLVLSVGTLFSGPDGGPDAVTNGTPTDTGTPTQTPAAAGDGTAVGTDPSATADEPTDAAETTPDTEPPPGTDPPTETETEPPATETPPASPAPPGTDSPTETGTESPTTESPTETPPASPAPPGTDSPTGTGTESPTTESPTATPASPAPPDTDSPTETGTESPTTESPTATPNGTQAPGGDQPNTGTGTPTSPGDPPIELPGDDDDEPPIELPGDDDDDGGATPDTPSNEGGNDTATANATDAGGVSGSPTASPGGGTASETPTAGSTATDGRAANDTTAATPSPTTAATATAGTDSTAATAGQTTSSGGAIPTITGNATSVTATDSPAATVGNATSTTTAGVTSATTSDAASATTSVASPTATGATPTTASDTASATTASAANETATSRPTNVTVSPPSLDDRPVPLSERAALRRP